jgi:putative tricarboxylic transport membrane protein
MHTSPIRTIFIAVSAIAAALGAVTAHAQGWKPEKPIEFTLPSGPGGSNDITGRIIYKIWSELNLVPVPTTIVNRAGGGHTVAYDSIHRRTGDPHYIGIMSTPMLMNHIEGRTTLSYNDVTPIAYLITEPMIVAVRPDSPIKSGRDLLEALKKNPKAFSFSLTSVGHKVSIGLPLQKAGVDFKSVRMATFKSGGETTTAVLGGHIDVVVTSVSTLVPFVAAGTMRALAVSSNKRLSGPMASIPTWNELGYQSSGSWKGVVAPKGITPAQVAFWEDVMRKAAQSEEMRKDADQNQWLVEYKNSAETRKWLDEENAALRVVLTDLGLAKQ